MTRDPAEPEAAEPFGLDELEDVEIPCRVEFARGVLDVSVFSRLTPQATLVLDTALGERGTFLAADVPLLRGICGARDGRRAFAA